MILFSVLVKYYPANIHMFKVKYRKRCEICVTSPPFGFNKYLDTELIENAQIL